MSITDLDEQLLVRAHQAGDDKAFGQIVRTQHRALYAHAFRRLGSHEAAEDAVQDTLLRAYRALPSFDGDLRLRAWLHRILTNVCHDEADRRRRQLGLVDKLEAQPVELAPDPVEEAVLHDTVRVMHEALTVLPETYREALVLRYVDGLSFREVAEATGISEENARARVHRGRLALRRALSRITVMLAFVIPGLRRTTQKAVDSGADAAVAGGGADQAMSLSTQLAAHVVQAAPMINRVAAEGSALVAAKSSVVATAVAAVAAVSAPVVAYQVYDTTRTPARPPAAVASPAIAEPPTSVVAGLDDGASVGASVSTSPSSASSLPPSAAAPFSGTPPVLSDDDAPNDDESPPPGRSTTTTSADAEVSHGSGGDTPPTIEGSLGGDAFDVTGFRPDFDVRGRVVLERPSGGPLAGVLSGSVYVADEVDGEAKAELELALDDGSVLPVRFRGTVTSEEQQGESTQWTLTGLYAIPGGEVIGLAERGDATVGFRHDRTGPSSLVLDVRGTQAE